MNTHTVSSSTGDTFQDSDALHIGALLFDARKASGKDLEDIGSTLKIKPSHLRAIEEGWWDELPSEAYVLGFLRSYARYLGLNDAEIIARYKHENSDIVVCSPARGLAPQPLEESRVPKTPIVIMSAVVALVGYCGWYFMAGSAYVAVDSTSVVPARLAALATPLPAPVEAAPIKIASVVPAPVVETLVVETPVVETVVLSAISVDTPYRVSVSVPAEIVQIAEIAQIAEIERPTRALRALVAVQTRRRGTSAVASTTFSAPSFIRSANAATGDDVSSRVTLRATADTWILVEDADAQTVRQGLLHEGELYRAPNQQGLTLTTSNMDALEILIDGTLIEPNNVRGSIERDLSLDAEQLASAF